MSFEQILSYTYNLVFYLIWLGGIVYAILNRRKHPFTSLSAAIALALMLFVNLSSTAFSIYTQYQISTGGYSTVKFIQMSQNLHLLTFPFSVLGQLVLLVAIFGWKKVPEHRPGNDHAG